MLPWEPKGNQMSTIKDGISASLKYRLVNLVSSPCLWNF